MHTAEPERAAKTAAAPQPTNPKPRRLGWTILWMAAIVIGLCGVVAATVVLAQHLPQESTGPLTVHCTETPSTVVHTVVIHDAMLPQHTTAKLCDKLTIANEDNQLRLVAFGVHEHHTPYDGITEELLAKGQSLTVTLNQAGTFLFHDHLEDQVNGTFTVTR